MRFERTLQARHEMTWKGRNWNGSFRAIESGSGPSPGSGRMPWFDPKPKFG
jgi:hypothetical protein